MVKSHTQKKGKKHSEGHQGKKGTHHLVLLLTLLESDVILDMVHSV